MAQPAPAAPRAPLAYTVQTLAQVPILPQRNNLLGEYLLTEGAGATAHDSSGLGNDAAVVGANWEGKMDLNFPISGSTLQLPAALNPVRSWQMLFFNPPFGSATLPQMPGYGGPQNGFPNTPVLLCGSDASHLCLFANSLFTKSHRAFAGRSDQTEAGVALPTGWHVLTFLCGNQTGNSITKTHILYDGSEVSSYVVQGDKDTCPAPTGGNFSFGGSADNSAAGFVGKLAGLWGWSSTLSVAEGAAAAQVALDLLNVRDIQTQFADVTNAAPVILGGFDSRTAGTGVTPQTVWLEQMVLDDPSYTRRNLAQSGATAYDFCVMFDSIFGEQIGGSKQPVVTVLWGGVNDGNETGQQIADDLHCMVAKAKAKGARVIVATEISSYANSTARGDALKNAVDAIVRPQALGWGADNLVDLATDPMLGADGASANATCFPDNLHPGPECEPRITAMMQNAVNEVLGSSPAAHHSSAAPAYQELAGDDFLDLTGSGVQQVTLPSCIGYALPRQIANLGSGSASVRTLNGETLTGNASLGPNAAGTWTPVPGALSRGGCSWAGTQ